MSDGRINNLDSEFRVQGSTFAKATADRSADAEGTLPTVVENRSV